MKMRSKLLLISILLISMLISGCKSQSVSTTVTSATTTVTSAADLITASPTVSDNSKVTTTPGKPTETPAEVKLPPKKVQGLVNITDIDKDIVIDLRYATADNFTGKVIYNYKTCLLREETAQKLHKANLQLEQSGYRIKIFDGYRPPSAQKILWSVVPNENFVANPSKGGSIHSRGAAVDITIIDGSGKELEMPSGFDDFTEKASRNNQNMSPEAKKNLQLLTATMIASGFTTISTEWWHYDDTDSKKYSTVEVDPSAFAVDN